MNGVRVLGCGNVIGYCDRSLHPDGLQIVTKCHPTSPLRDHFDTKRYPPSATCSIVQTHCGLRKTTAQLLLTEHIFTNHKHIFIHRVQLDAISNENLTCATRSWTRPGCQWPNSQRPGPQLNVGYWAVDRHKNSGAASRVHRIAELLVHGMSPGSPKKHVHAYVLAKG